MGYRQEVVYLNRDNYHDVVLLADGVPADVSTVTRVILDLPSGTDIDSATEGMGAGLTFDVTNTTQVDVNGVTYLSQPYLRMQLGQVAGLAAGTYSNVHLITFDANNPNGIVWTDQLELLVKDSPSV